MAFGPRELETDIARWTNNMIWVTSRGEKRHSNNLLFQLTGGEHLKENNLSGSHGFIVFRSEFDGGSWGSKEGEEDSRELHSCVESWIFECGTVIELCLK
jgi:hypothetical protein